MEEGQTMNVLSSKCGQVTGFLEKIQPVGEDIVAGFACYCPRCGHPEVVEVAFPGRIWGQIEVHMGQRITVLRNGEDYHVREVGTHGPL